MYNQRGITLLELMITIAIVSLVIVLGAPSIVEGQRTLRFKGALETSYFALQAARADAISSSSDVTVTFNATQPWCIGASDAGPCDCQVANSCQINGIEQVVSGADYNEIQLQNVNFGANNATVFDGQRGMTQNSAGSVTFTDGSAEARMEVNNVGRIRICMDDGELGTYPEC